ncbi:MAG: FtsX-like permease family protein, partial [Bacteroidota bacterium]
FRSWQFGSLVLIFLSRRSKGFFYLYCPVLCFKRPFAEKALTIYRSSLMNLPLKIARRYLFAKKSTNAINLISGISVFGISVGTAALILVLSVFNGFEDLITGLFSNFNPDVKVTPLQGKTFSAQPEDLAAIEALEGVEYVSQTLEEIAFFEYKGSQDFGTLKGVDEYYHRVTQIDSTIREGIYRFVDGQRQLAVFGVGMRNKLSINIEDYLSTVSVYMPKRKQGLPTDRPFKERLIYPAGTFVIQQDFDNQYVLCSLEFIRGLLGLKSDEISSIEIKLQDAAPTGTVAAIREILGPNFVVKDRYQQDEAFLKLMNIEKWMSYAILSLTIVLVAFNMIGALWMIVLDKKKDIAILKAMGAHRDTIRNIFLGEGILLCLFGMLSGFAIALLFYLVQKSFGIVPIPAGFVVDAYPISMRLFDFIIVALTVMAIGLLASVPPALRAAQVSALIRED